MKIKPKYGTARLRISIIFRELLPQPDDCGLEG